MTPSLSNEQSQIWAILQDQVRSSVISLQSIVLTTHQDFMDFGIAQPVKDRIITSCLEVAKKTGLRTKIKPVGDSTTVISFQDAIAFIESE